MKKYIKIIFVNVFLSVIIFFLFDIIVYYGRLYKSHLYKPPFTGISYFKRISKSLNQKAVEYEIFNNKNLIRRPVENINSPKKAITLFGCSFVEGHVLNDDETFSYKLGKYTGAPVYNRAAGGWGIQHMLFQLKSDIFYQIVPESEFVIYTYINDHERRTHVANEPTIFGGRPAFVYRKKGSGYVFDNYSAFMFHFPLLSLIKQTFYLNFYDFKKSATDIKSQLLEVNKEIKNHWPNAKFIVFAYEDDRLISYISNDLRKNGIDVVSFRDLTGLDYNDIRYCISKDDWHPNKEAWNLIVLLLMKHIKFTKNSNYKNEETISDENYSNLNNPEYAEACSPFSMCKKDHDLVENKKISLNDTRIAYIYFCIGDFLKNIKLKKASSFFMKKAQRKNPYNEIYRYVNL